MNKKAELLFCFIFILTLFVLINFKKNEYIPQSIKISNIKYEQKEKVNPLIDKLNETNRKINSISYSENKIYLDGISVKSNINYEKNLKFRMISKSILGIENDIGSNENDFWFWSKRMTPPHLFYSSHQNLKKTRLRTPFNPHWMMQILGVDEIKSFDKSFYYKEYLAVASYDENNYGKKITKIQLINYNKNCFYGHYIFNAYDELIVSAEVSEYYSVNGFNVPKTINITWLEENVYMKWELGKPTLNGSINNSYWQMPTNHHKVDLNGYVP
jgi:hypothetical protein